MLVSFIALYHDRWKRKRQLILQHVSSSFEDSSTVQQQEAISERNDGRGLVSLSLSHGSTFHNKRTAPRNNGISTIIDKLKNIVNDACDVDVCCSNDDGLT